MNPSLKYLITIKEIFYRFSRNGLKNKLLSSTVKFGGGYIMVYGCFNHFCVGRLVFINGITDAEKYYGILSDILLPFATQFG